MAESITLIMIVIYELINFVSRGIGSLTHPYIVSCVGKKKSEPARAKDIY
jgi:hypothetical protein